MEFLVLIFFIFVIAKIVGDWLKNENSPRLTVPAKIVDKRRATHHHHANGHHHHSHSYHLTFEVESGDRMELKVSRSEYDELLVGESGMLSFQGSRFLGFVINLTDGEKE